MGISTSHLCMNIISCIFTLIFFTLFISYQSDKRYHHSFIQLPDRCRDVLIHPIVPRHRYFLIKSRMFPSKCRPPAPSLLPADCRIPSPAVAASSARVAATSLALALFSGQATAPPWANPLQLASTFLSIWACVMGWMVGHAMIDIVFSERLRLSQRQDAAPFPVLIAQGIASDDAIVQVVGMTLITANAVVEIPIFNVRGACD